MANDSLAALSLSRNDVLEFPKIPEASFKCLGQHTNNINKSTLLKNNYLKVLRAFLQFQYARILKKAYNTALYPTYPISFPSLFPSLIFFCGFKIKNKKIKVRHFFVYVYDLFFPIFFPNC